VGAECLCAALQFLLSPAYLLFIPSPLEGEGRVRGSESYDLVNVSLPPTIPIVLCLVAACTYL